MVSVAWRPGQGFFPGPMGTRWTAGRTAGVALHQWGSGVQGFLCRLRGCLPGWLRWESGFPSFVPCPPFVLGWPGIGLASWPWWVLRDLKLPGLTVSIEKCVTLRIPATLSGIPTSSYAKGEVVVLIVFPGSEGSQGLWSYFVEGWGLGLAGAGAKKHLNLASFSLLK